MIKINQPFLFIALNLFIILLFFYLPYYLFDGRLFLGGDDTRFHYAYPREVLNSLSIYSWNNISSLPLYLPNHHSIPFLYTASLLAGIINSKVHLFYFLFSLPLVLGFIFFQKLIRELLGKECYSFYCGFNLRALSYYNS
jgi:hypothetical protein